MVACVIDIFVPDALCSIWKQTSSPQVDAVYICVRGVPQIIDNLGPVQKVSSRDTTKDMNNVLQLG